MDRIFPVIRTPLTDMTGHLLNHQTLGRCSKQEREMSDCYEAYGLDRGRYKCKDFIEDFRECHTMAKQFKRFLAMRKERKRQMASGVLTREDYVSPKVDAF